MLSSNAASCKAAPSNFHQHRSSERGWPNSGPGAFSLPQLSPSLLCIPFRAQLPAWLGAPTQRGVRSSIQPLQGHSTELTPLLGHTIVAGMAESTKHLYNLSLISITFSELLRAVLSALHPVLHYGFEHLLQWPSFLGHIFRGLTTCLIISPLQT